MIKKTITVLQTNLCLKIRLSYILNAPAKYLYQSSIFVAAFPTSQKPASGIDDSSNSISFKKNYNNTNEVALDSINSVNQRE